MPVYLDDEPMSHEGSNLASLLDAAHKKLADTGRVVVELIVNGQPVLSQELDKQGDTLTPDAEVRLYSADPRLLASSVLGDLRLELDRAREAQANAARLFQHDQPADAMRAVGEAIVVWQTAQQGLMQSSQLVGINLDQQRFEDRAVTEFLNDVIGKIRQLRDLIEAGDTVGLSDTLGYEWPELTDRLDRLIAEVIGWIETAKR